MMLKQVSVSNVLFRISEVDYADPRLETSGGSFDPSQHYILTDVP